MRRLFGLVLVMAVIAMGAYVLGYWTFDEVNLGSWRREAPAAEPVGASTARDRMGQLDAQASGAADKVGDFASDAELTAKIKSKLALDDSVRARAIHVSTTGGIVTLSGTFGSTAEHDRVVRLARETKGLKQVVDRLSGLLP